jgi:hypothetical protein
MTQVRDLTFSHNAKGDVKDTILPVLPKFVNLEVLSFAQFEDTSVLTRLATATFTLPRVHTLNLFDCYDPPARNAVFRRLASRLPNLKKIHISFDTWDILVCLFHYGGELLTHVIPDSFKKLETFELLHLPTSLSSVIEMTQRFLKRKPVTIKHVACVSVGNPEVSARERRMIEQLGVGERNRMDFEVLEPCEDFPKGGYSFKFYRT